jgi:ATP-dependent DNA helicase RecG
MLQQDITYLKGVGPQKANVLASELKIKTYADLLYHFPYRYLDRTRFYAISELAENMSYVQLKGKILSVELIGVGRKSRLEAMFSDGVSTIKLVWFKGIQYIKPKLNGQQEFVIFGKPTLFNRSFNFTHPEFETFEEYRKKLTHKFQALYPTTEKMKQVNLHAKAIHSLQMQILAGVKGKITETLPAWLLHDQNLLGINDALYNIHLPIDQDLLAKAEYRLKFEELLYVQLKILSLKVARTKAMNAYYFKQVGENFNTFYKEHIPFDLTNAQKRVLKEIRHDCNTGYQMNRLLQGDVGSGKTLVALMSMLLALDNGFQACLMAPTEILANQHYQSISEMLFPMGVQVGLLTGSTKQSERKRLHAALEAGDLKILIGTHALIEDKVVFKNLGLAVIDEQHRFGVAQRSKMWKKNQHPPHVLVMTATPIPRTLAMTLYGDLDVSVIDELPPGRKPIQTFHYTDSKRRRVFGFMKEQIKLGRQIYIVYPLIKESEAMDYKDLEDGLEGVSRAFPPPEYGISVVHGKMKPEEKDKSMDIFARGMTDILIATTVIEVGVNVPNASVMIIESAERFGLSQLHQLRGRVGRGADQSYCILMTGYKLSKEGKTRMETMVRTNDGFELSEVDLKLRGPGDLEGTQQSGLGVDLKLANITRDNQLLNVARNVAEKILQEDPDLLLEKNSILKKYLKEKYQKQFNWSSIS